MWTCFFEVVQDSSCYQYDQVGRYIFTTMLCFAHVSLPFSFLHIFACITFICFPKLASTSKITRKRQIQRSQLQRRDRIHVRRRGFRRADVSDQMDLRWCLLFFLGAGWGPWKNPSKPLFGWCLVTSKWATGWVLSTCHCHLCFF